MLKLSKPSLFLVVSIFSTCALNAVSGSSARQLHANSDRVSPEGPASNKQIQGKSEADLIITNGRVFTGDFLRPDSSTGSKADPPKYASAIACAQGKVIYVGDDHGAIFYKGPKTKFLNAGAHLILPGFHDCHVHLCEGGIEARDCQLNGVKNKQAALNKFRQYAAKVKKTTSHTDWLKAAGLPLPAVKDSPLTREDLDTVDKDRPVIVLSEDAHSVWLNTKALKLAQVDASTKTSPAGIIEHDKDGSPNGCLREEAMELAEKAIPLRPLMERTEALKKAVLLANSYGITSIQDAHAKEDFLTTYLDLAKRGALNLKVVAALHVAPGFKDKDFDHLVLLREKYTHGNLRATAAKIFADGVIETHTAALLAPYLDRPSTSGTLNYSLEELKRTVLALDKRGFQVHIHTIGDRAVRAALDAFEAARAQGGTAYESHRHQMAHLEIIDKADIPRFQSLSVIANFQAFWAFNDPYMTELTLPALGPERMKLIYPIGSVLKTGARLAAGSDWTVSTLNPLLAMQVATTRKAPGNPFAKVLLKEQCIPLKNILAAYTTGGAYANHSEARTGSLTVGKDADLIILDRDIFSCKPETIGQTKVLKTFLEGKLVYDRGRKSDRGLDK